MFEIGDNIIYGNNGVCEVTKIGLIDLSGIENKKVYYTLQPVYTKGSILYTPVDNKKVVMRKILSKDEARKLIDDIPNIDLFWEENDKLREEKMKEAMKKYDCREWIKVIKTLYIRGQKRKEQGKKITNIEEKYLSIAEESLYGELAIPLNIPKEDMVDFITNRLKSLEKI